MYRRILNGLRRIPAFVTPSADAWSMASKAVACGWLLFLAALIVELLFVDFTMWKTAGFLVVLGCLLLAGGAVLLIVRLMGAIPRNFAIALLLPLPLAYFVLIEFGPKATAVLVTAAVFGTALIAGAVPTLVKSSDRRREYASVLSLVTGVTVCATAIYVTFVKHDEPNQPLIGYQLTDSTLDLPDPSLTGPRDVLHTTYGSGNDRHRPEFGVEAGFVSEAVDGSKLIDNWKGAVGWTRTGYWGFGVDELPVQGRVWYPDGEGPYPLVLIVHGNHSMEDFSDGGYEYLGRLAASRGYIFVSVDENFLNSSLGDLVNPIKPRLEEENDARAWLLLEHLRQWRTWQQTPEHPFDGLVDMSNITLIGHSRGGEAVAIAAHFNRLGHYPDDATLTFDYNFAIKGGRCNCTCGRSIQATRCGHADAERVVFHHSRQYGR